MPEGICFKFQRVSEAGVGADASVRPMSSREFSQYSVGADAYIGPPGSCEFAADYRKKRCNLPGRCRHRPLHRNGQCMRMCRSFSQNQLHSAGRTESSTHTKQNDIDRDRTFLTRCTEIRRAAMTTDAKTSPASHPDRSPRARAADSPVLSDSRAETRESWRCQDRGLPA